MGTGSNAHINFYSSILFPIYKYNPVTNRMVRSNKRVAYLFTALSMVILWGFIASIVLDIEFRYIGLGISALAAGVIMYYYGYLIFNSTNIAKELIAEYLTVNDILECYKLSASISADYKNLAQKGKIVEGINIIEEFKEISARKRLKFQRELERKLAVGCGISFKSDVRRYNALKDKLERAGIEKMPKPDELKGIDESTLDDMLYIHQMKEFASFAHTVLSLVHVAS